MRDSIDSRAEEYSTGMLSPPDWRTIWAVPAECVRAPLDMLGPRLPGGPRRPRIMPPSGPPEDGPLPGHDPPPGGIRLPGEPAGYIDTSGASSKHNTASALASARDTPSSSRSNSV